MFNDVNQCIIGLGGHYILFPEKEKMDIVKLLPQEMTNEIFSYLHANELNRCFRVSKAWKVLASHDALSNPKIVFGKKQWAKYFGDIGKEPSLPKDIHKILRSPCPFFPEKKVEETHILVLIPQTIDEVPLQLNTLKGLVKAPNYQFFWDEVVEESIHLFSLRELVKANRQHPNYQYLSNEIEEEYGIPPIGRSHWALMTKSLIPNSIGKSFMDQCALISDVAKKTGIEYKVPNALDAAICVFIQYIRTKERLFEWPCTRCQEKIVIKNGLRFHVSVQGTLTSVNIYSGSGKASESGGIAAVRKFF